MKFENRSRKWLALVLSGYALACSSNSTDPASTPSGGASAGGSSGSAAASGGASGGGSAGAPAVPSAGGSSGASAGSAPIVGAGTTDGDGSAGRTSIGGAGGLSGASGASGFSGGSGATGGAGAPPIDGGTGAASFHCVNCAVNGDNVQPGPLLLSGVFDSDTSYDAVKARALAVENAYTDLLKANSFRMPINEPTVNTQAKWDAYKAVIDVGVQKGMKVIVAFWAKDTGIGRPSTLTLGTRCGRP